MLLAIFEELRIALAIYQRNPGKLEKKELIGAILNMHRLVKTAHMPERIELISQYRNELVSIKKTLTVIGSKHDASIRKPGIALFEDLPISNHVPLNLTSIFREFIKGITYFKDQEETANPIYHRLYSCGPFSENKSHRNMNNKCILRLSRAERKKRHIAGETCYIERIIYNRIYAHEMAEMVDTTIKPIPVDAGHVQSENEAYLDYVSCCREWDMKVVLDFNLLGAVGVTIKRLKKNRIVSEETYTRTIIPTGFGGVGWKYDDLVHCTKTAGTQTFFKVQTYNRQRDWRLLQAATTDDLNNTAESPNQSMRYTA
jgi:hypothetical protein